MYCGLLPVLHRFDAYYSTSYSRGIRWLPSPEVCRMVNLALYKHQGQQPTSPEVIADWTWMERVAL